MNAVLECVICQSNKDLRVAQNGKLLCACCSDVIKHYALAFLNTGITPEEYLETHQDEIEQIVARHGRWFMDISDN